MNRLQDERGSTMLLMLFIIVIFTLLGLAVVSASIGGAARTETKQKDVQSLHLAEKALNEAVAMVQGKLQSLGSINIEQLPDQLRDVINQMNDEQAHVVSSQYAGQVITDAELVKVKPVPTINVHVTATIDGVTRTLTQVLEISSYPDALNYAAGSEGNMIINGSPYFLNDVNTEDGKGGIYAGAEIRIKNRAEYVYADQDLRADTKFPELLGTAYVQSIKNIKYCAFSPTVNCEDPVKDYSTVQEADGNSENSSIHKVLGDSSIAEVKNKKEFKSVNMEESFIDKLTESIGGTEATHSLLENSFTNSGPSGAIETLISLSHSPEVIISPEKITGNESSEEIVQKNENWNTYKALLNSEIGDLTIVNKGNLILDHSELNSLTFTPSAKQYREPINGSGSDNASHWVIVDGDLDIYNQMPDNPIEIRSNILVTGDVNISGYVKTDATIIALGATTIQDATIEGLERQTSTGTEKSELVLFTKGDILITRVNTNADGSFKHISDDAFHDLYESKELQSGGLTKLDAFFYTEKTAMLYGVGSVFWINGGFFSKGDLTINAVRGDVDVENNVIVPEPQPGISGQRARFIISYNSNIIDHQAAALPRVKSYQLNKGKKVLSNEQTPASP